MDRNIPYLHFQLRTRENVERQLTNTKTHIPYALADTFQKGQEQLALASRGKYVAYEGIVDGYRKTEDKFQNATTPVYILKFVPSKFGEIAKSIIEAQKENATGTIKLRTLSTVRFALDTEDDNNLFVVGMRRN